MKSPMAFELSFLKFSGMNVLGQTAKHAWQSGGHSPFIIGFVSSMLMRLSGHAYSHAPHNTHAPTSMTFDFRSANSDCDTSNAMESSDFCL